MRVIIPTSNSHAHMCQPCLDMLNISWREARPDDEIVFLCYDNKPIVEDHYAEDHKEPSRVTVYSLGDQVDYGSSWTKGIVQYLKNNSCDHFVLMCEDHIIHHVDHERLKIAEELIKIDDVSKVELTFDYNLGYVRNPHFVSSDPTKVGFVEKHQNARYRTSVMPSIWKTSYFLKYAWQCNSAWDFEMTGSELAKNDGAVILAYYGGIVDVQNFLKRGKLQERPFMPLDFKRKMMSMVCPTRGRPERFAKLLESIKRNTVGDWELIVGIDKDDPKRNEYDLSDPHIVVYSVDGISVVELFDRMAKAAVGDLVQTLADDCVIDTFGWDAMIRREMPKDGIFVTACFDGKRVTSFHQCVGKKLIDTIGYMYMPALHSYYPDPWLEQIAKYCGRLLVLPELTIRHEHDEIDDATRQKMREKAARDKVIYRRGAYERMQAAYKLREVMRADV